MEVKAVRPRNAVGVEAAGADGAVVTATCLGSYKIIEQIGAGGMGP